MTPANLIFNITPDVKHIMEEFQIKYFNTKDSDLTYRTLNHYQELDIIEKSKIKLNSWRKLSGVELVWINVILILRDLGINLEKIQLLKAKLFDQGKLGSIDKLQSINNSFELEIALTIIKGYELHFIIFSDFSYSFHDSQSIKHEHLKTFKQEAHINIPMTKIIKETYKKIIKKNELTMK